MVFRGTAPRPSRLRRRAVTVQLPLLAGDQAVGADVGVGDLIGIAAGRGGDPLGHNAAIPTALLAEAAAGYLPGQQRVSDDPQWIDTVLRTLCQDPGKRVNGALTVLIPD